MYVWSAGVVHLLTVLPGGESVRGTLAGARPYPRGCAELYPQSAPFTRSVSVDGERMLFYAGGGFEFTAYSIKPNAPYIHGGLYLREHPGAEESAQHECTAAEQASEPEKACTLQIDVPEAGAPSGAKAGEGQFQWANAETTKIFFTDEEPLVSGSTAEGGKPDLYEYDLEKPEDERLTDLTVNAAEPADVLGVAGASEDGSYVYFVAKGVLSGGQENSHNAKALAGEANLYLRHGRTTTFIATLNAAGGDQCDWTAYCLTARVSSNGAFIAFDSIDSLTGYDNHPVRPEACRYSTEVPGAPCMQTFRYAAAGGAHGELTCASCNPSGTPPASEFAWSVIQQTANTIGGGGDLTMQATHAVSDAGQVFFDTMEELVPTDENKTWDVYQYDGGEGSGAQLHLISSGASGLPSYFIDATPDGSNVFFVTAQSLLRADTRDDYDLYDARVGGGFAAQNEAIARPPCEGVEGCRSPLTEPPAEFSVASATLSGPGNLVSKPEQPAVKEPAKPKTKQLTRKQRLERALGACAKRYRHKPKGRRRCERQARARYGAKANHARPRHGRAGK